MSEKRRKFDQEFREGAVRIVRETGKPIAQVARDLGINGGTLGNWVAKDRAEREGTQGLSTGDIAELKRLRSEVAESADGARCPQAISGPVGVIPISG
jgi:transposase